MSGSVTDPLVLYDELVIEGHAPPAAEFCARFPQQPSLAERIRVLEAMRARLHAAMQPQRASVTLPKSVGGFELLRLLGRGGMAEVYLARQRSPARLCALKVLTDASQLRLERFRREAEIAASLSHPGIATVYAAGVEGGVAFLASELVHGVPLCELLRVADSVSAPSSEWLTRAFAVIADAAPHSLPPEQPLPVPLAVELGLQLCEAMAYAHENGVVHRDLKPSNVMVTFEGRTKVVDFGIAVALREAEARLTATGAFVGTFDYAAPEQLCGDKARQGPASDVYALAALLYELLTQRTPFEVASLGERLACVEAAPRRSPRQLNPHVPAALDAVLMRALSYDPAQRYEDAGAFFAALRRPTRRTWLPPPPRPSTLLRVAAVAGLVTIVAVLFGLLVDTRARLHEERRDFERERSRAAQVQLEMALPRVQGALERCLNEARRAAAKARQRLGARWPELIGAHRRARLQGLLVVDAGAVTEVRVSGSAQWQARLGLPCMIEVLKNDLVLPGVGLRTPQEVDLLLDFPDEPPSTLIPSPSAP